ncbi:MAG: hypothetical protein JWM27_3002 [Gemmatimonadetes bacterium]|nr:hypothetical protein [Gemmatimonadota bacterium]
MSVPPTLCFFAAPPGGGRVVLEVSPPDSAGRVAFREWDASADASSARTGSTTPAELDRRLREWKRAGWTLGESAEHVLGWLRAHPAAS